MAIPTSIKTLLSGDVVEWARIEIVSFLKELHLTEGRNTGFGKILRALEENGSPKPEFETDDDHSYFISRLFVQEAFLKEENTQAGTEKELKRSQKKEPKKSWMYYGEWKKIR